MKRLLVLLIAVTACCPKHFPPEIIIRDSLVVEYRDSLVYRDSIVNVPIPLESDQAIVTVNDTSHRETSLAESDAWVGSDGFLHHSIRNKKGSIGFHVSIPEHWVVDKAHQEQSSTITRTVYVEKHLNGWQKFRLRGFWWLLAALACSLAYIFRKPLLALFGKLPL